MTLREFYNSEKKYALYIKDEQEFFSILDSVKEYWDALKKTPDEKLSTFLEMANHGELCLSNSPGYSSLGWYIGEHYEILTLDDISDIGSTKPLYIVTVYGNIKEVLQN